MLELNPQTGVGALALLSGNARVDGTLAKLGSLEVRLARTEADIHAAQEVRYRVFYEEMGAALASPSSIRRDADRFDDVCDHLIVCDMDLPGPDDRRVVGTYRLLRQERAAAAGGFYSTAEFDLERLIARNPGKRFMELGRSCVLPAYRSKRTIEALWQAIWAYVREHGVDVMAGCASFPGVVPAAHTQALSFLAHNCGASENWAVRAVTERYQPMDLMPAEALDAKEAIKQMPPLVKGYLKLGARFGDGCVIDHEFGTVDVFVVLPVASIAQRYIDYYTVEPKLVA